MPLNRVRNHILTRNVRLALLHEAPAALGEVPVHDGEADDVLEALEPARNERAVRPRARVADVEVVAALLGGVLRAGFARDGVAERGDLALELAGFVAGLDPVCDFAGGRLCMLVSYLFILVSLV